MNPPTQPQSPLRWVLRYVLALGAVTGAMGLQLALTAWVGPGLPAYITFYPAVMAVALAAGFGPGLVATAGAGFLAAYFILPPTGHFAIALPVDRLGLVIFSGMGLFMSAFAELYLRSKDKAAAYDREAAVRESRERLATFAQATFEGIVESEAGRIVDCNEQLARMLGYAIPELKGIEISSLIAPEDQERVMANIRHDRESAIEHAIIRKDGTRIIVEAHGRTMSSGGARRYTAVRDVTSRKQAEEVLRQTMEHERFLADVVEKADVAFGVGAPDGRLLMFNQAFADLTGYSREELNKRQLTWTTDLTPIEWREFEAARLAESVRIRRHVRYEKEYIRKDGTRVPIELFVQPVFDAGNNLLHYRTFLTNITERKRAEEALRESEKQFHTLADSIPNLAWWANGDGYITWYNRRWYEYTGTTPEQMEGWGWQSVHDPKVLPTVLERWKASIATGQSLDMEFPLRGADGVFRPFLTRVLPLKDSAGLVLRWFGTNTDISARKRAEEALRGSEKQHRELFENMIEGFAFCQMVFENGKPQDFIYLSVNHAFETLTGLKNVVGKKVTDVIPGIREADPKLIEIYGRVSLTGKSERFEIFLEALKMWFSISVYSPKKEFFVAVFDVITERKLAEQALRQRTVELEEANRELEAFSYSVSHDLRAPLRHMTGFADLLETRSKSQLDETSLHYVSVISQAAARMGVLIDDLLAFSRIGRTAIRMKRVSLTALAREVIQEMDAEVKGRDIGWRIGELSDVYGDPSMLKLVLANLISNAIKFTRTRSRAEIEIGCGEEKEESVFFVKDNGVGFDMNYADQLFGVFQRLCSREEFEGTGIGLANVRRIISRHGGRTWAEGSLGEGAIVYFTLPKIKEA